MKKLIVIVLLVGFSFSVYGQSRSVEDFRNQYRPDLKLFFYKSTLRMFAQLAVQFADDGQEIPDIASLVDGVEKIKYFSYEPSTDLSDLTKKLKEGVISEGYEVAFDATLKGSKIQLYLKGPGEKPDGYVAFVQVEEGLQLMDIEGSPDLNKLIQFATYVSENKDSFTLADALR